MIFDALSNDQKKMLIHIAYNLIGQKKAIVEDRLHHLFGVWAKDGINMLLHKSLVKIDEQGQVTMHHLTHNMVKDMEYGKKEDQPASNYGSMCDSVDLDKNGHVMEETQPSSNDYEPMECEYQNCSTSSS